MSNQYFAIPKNTLLAALTAEGSTGLFHGMHMLSNDKLQEHCAPFARFQDRDTFLANSDIALVPWVIIPKVDQETGTWLYTWSNLEADPEDAKRLYAGFACKIGPSDNKNGDELNIIAMANQAARRAVGENFNLVVVGEDDGKAEGQLMISYTGAVIVDHSGPIEQKHIALMFMALPSQGLDLQVKEELYKSEGYKTLEEVLDRKGEWRASTRWNSILAEKLIKDEEDIKAARAAKQ